MICAAEGQVQEPILCSSPRQQLKTGRRKRRAGFQLLDNYRRLVPVNAAPTALVTPSCPGSPFVCLSDAWGLISNQMHALSPLMSSLYLSIPGNKFPPFLLPKTAMTLGSVVALLSQQSKLSLYKIQLQQHGEGDNAVCLSPTNTGRAMPSQPIGFHVESL